VPGFNAVNRFGYKMVHYNYDTPAEEIISGINSHGLNIICGSPAFLSRLAPYAAGIRVKTDAVMSYAEILEPHVKPVLEKAFRAPVHQLYAGTEGYYASSCRLGTLHLNEDIIYFNLLPVAGRPGVFNMVVTDLYRKTQPIINYELNDMIELSDEKCPCGSNFRAVKAVIGRADDYLILNGPKGDVIVYADFPCRALIAAVEGINDYKIVQKSRDKIEVYVEFVPGSGGQDSLNRAKAAVEEVMIKYAGHAPAVEVREEKLVFDTEKKLKRVERLF
jgi:putative adenylate-forming enzyme